MVMVEDKHKEREKESNRKRRSVEEGGREEGTG